jgi:predicted RNA-binding protein (virulence factor B family)
VGDTVIAHAMVDEKTDRIIATTKLNKRLNQQPAAFRPGQPVALVIRAETPLGYNAIVEGTHQGLLYHTNVGAPLQIGQKLKGYVTAVRAGGKLDLSLDARGYQRVAPLTEQILAALKARGGQMPYDDDSAPEVIRQQFECSKKAFKQALGALFRQRKIRFTHPGIAESDLRDGSGEVWQPGPPRD